MPVGEGVIVYWSLLLCEGVEGWLSWVVTVGFSSNRTMVLVNALLGGETVRTQRDWKQKYLT